MYEPAGQPGLAGATARLLTEGTKTRTSKQIAEQIDSLGASLSASAGFGSGSAVVAASGLSDTFEQWFALTADVLLHPSFPADELAQYQSRAKSALLQQRSQPGFPGESDNEPRVVRNISRGRRFGDAGVARCADARDARGLARQSITRRRTRFWQSPEMSTPTTLDPKAAPMAGGMAAFESVRGFPARPAAGEKRKDISHRPPGVGANHTADGQPGNRADQSGLSGAGCVE